MAFTTTGKNSVDSLLWGLSFTGNTGQAASITYASSTRFGNEESANIAAALKGWSNVANVTFNKTLNSANANLIFSREDLGTGILGLAQPYAIGSRVTQAYIKFDDRFTNADSIKAGTLGYLTILHEIGHGLGLKHPGDYGASEDGPFLPTADDHLSASVMSYYDKTYGKNTPINENVNAPATPMIYDIAAIQHIYGANTSFNAGATTYGFSGTSTVQTIWDGGGIDTVSAASVKTAVRIDLREGVYNYSVIGKAYVWNAFNSNIENGSGGSGNDALYGNTLNNKLAGNAGNDKFYAYTGNDTLYGGIGNDSLYGDSTTVSSSGGNDSLYGGAGNDMLRGSGGNDRLTGDHGADQLHGDAGNDILIGDSSTVAKAGDGNDTLAGGAGGDTLWGGGGADWFVFGAAGGRDVIGNFEGEGRSGGDVLRIASTNLNSSGFNSTAALAAAVSYVGTTGTLNFGGGNLIVIKGLDSHLIAGDFYIG